MIRKAPKLDRAHPSPSLAALDQTAISYEIERQVVLPRGIFEIGKFRWSAPVDFEMRPEKDRVSFNLALSPRPLDGWIIQTDQIGREHRKRLERLMLLNPGSNYRLIMAPGNVRTLYCSIECQDLEDLIGQPLNLTRENWQAQTKRRMPVIELLLNRIHEELRDENFASDAAIEAYAKALRVELARCLKTADPGPPAIRRGGLAPWRWRLLEERIHADMPAPRLPELAELCGMTVRQLSRAYKEETGKTLGSHVDEVTLKRAIALLTESDQPIGVIATNLGFATPASFANAFRRSAGVCPRELRERTAI
jgi:AraC family transcriptional regulator